jgi:hypothetical protein
MKNKTVLLFTIVGIYLLSSSFVFAQDHEEKTENESKDHYNKHHIALFNGATTVYSSGATEYTVAVDYEYRFSKLFGVGVIAESIIRKKEELLFGVAFFAHPYKGFKFFAAPLLVYGEEHQDSGHDTNTSGHDSGEEAKKEVSFTFRLGTGYDFHVWKLSIGPVINFDFGKANAINYGLSIGFGF